jgi:hypothetical protein
MSEIQAYAIKIQTRWRHRNDASISNALSQLVEIKERTLHDLGVTSLDKVDKTAIQAAIASHHNMSTGELDKDRAQHQGDEEMSVFRLPARLTLPLTSVPAVVTAHSVSVSVPLFLQVHAREPGYARGVA